VTNKIPPNKRKEKIILGDR